MRTRSRVPLAVVVALLAHAGARELVQGAAIRSIARAPAPEGERVVVTLAPVLPERASARDARLPAPRVAHGARAVSPTVDAAPPTIDTPAAAPAQGPVVDAAPGGPSIVAQPEPRSFLERVIAGTSGLPPPRMDELLRAPPVESDGEAARQKIQALVSAAGARGAPPVDAGSLVEQLEPLDGGGYRYATGGFIATIHKNGAVSFENLDNKGGLGASALPGRSGDLFEPYAPPIETFSRLDGVAAPREMGLPGGMPGTTLASGSFDPTAALLRAQGQDPYEHEKLCFLDETMSIRAELRVAHEKTQMAGLRRSLERAWFDDAHTPAARRAALFSIWDECREEEVGLLARELVESFVRQHLPRGSPDAFTAQELAALNATRASTLEFAPYG